MPAHLAETLLTSPAAANPGGITALGTADLVMKTQRPTEPSQLMVTGVRIGKHPNFERVVFDFIGSGHPGWFIDYTAHPAQQGSGNPIDFDGTTALNVNIDGTVLPFEIGAQEPNIGTVPGQGGFITEVISAGTFEGRSQFIIGLTGQRPYSVQILNNPTRLVIDIAQN